MIVGVPKETCPGERRVALVPATVAALAQAGHEVLLERDAGTAAGFPDSAYEAKGARLVANRAEVFSKAEIVLAVRMPAESGAQDELGLLRKGQGLICLMRPLSDPKALEVLARTGATAFALELMPRITRAQSMDVLSSMATVAGYRAVLLAASLLPRLFPMLMTAAGTIKPARVLIIGAGVAGLQAIATARRLGAVVEAYDVRPAAREQILSLGAKPVELALETKKSEDAGGYATAQDESFYDKQRQLLAPAVARSDAIITTAAVPGQPAPVLIDEAMVDAMAPGSVIVDLVAEQGGNCALTKAGEQVRRGGVTIVGPLDLVSEAANDASQMFAKNVLTFLTHLVGKEGLVLDPEDPIARDTLVGRDGELVNPRIRKLLGLPEQAADSKGEG